MAAQSQPGDESHHPGFSQDNVSHSFEQLFQKKLTQRRRQGSLKINYSECVQHCFNICILVTKPPLAQTRSCNRIGRWYVMFTSLSLCGNPLFLYHLSQAICREGYVSDKTGGATIRLTRVSCTSEILLKKGKVQSNDIKDLNLLFKCTVCDFWHQGSLHQNKRCI